MFTKEGNVAGARAGRLAAQRRKEQQEYLDQRAMLEKKHSTKSVLDMSAKFAKKRNNSDAKFKSQTVGLVQVEEFKRLREETALSARRARAAVCLRVSVFVRVESYRHVRLAVLCLTQPDCAAA